MRGRQFIHVVPTALTRISVTGAADGYLVRNGDESPVKVRHGRHGLQCECGRQDCAHIESLMLCGFVEEAEELAKAA